MFLNPDYNHMMQSQSSSIRALLLSRRFAPLVYHAREKCHNGGIPLLLDFVVHTRCPGENQTLSRRHCSRCRLAMSQITRCRVFMLLGSEAKPRSVGQQAADAGRDSVDAPLLRVSPFATAADKKPDVSSLLHHGL